MAPSGSRQLATVSADPTARLPDPAKALRHDFVATVDRAEPGERIGAVEGRRPADLIEERRFSLGSCHQLVDTADHRQDVAGSLPHGLHVLARCDVDRKDEQAFGYRVRVELEPSFAAVGVLEAVLDGPGDPLGHALVEHAKGGRLEHSRPLLRELAADQILLASAVAPSRLVQVEVGPVGRENLTPFREMLEGVAVECLGGCQCCGRLDASGDVDSHPEDARLALEVEPMAGHKVGHDLSLGGAETGLRRSLSLDQGALDGGSHPFAVAFDEEAERVTAAQLLAAAAGDPLDVAVPAQETAIRRIEVDHARKAVED